MASFSSELQKLLTQFGGYAQGIPQIERHKSDIREQGQRDAYKAGEADLFGFQKAGLGRSAGAAFAQGGRQAMGSRDSARQILDLITQSAQLKSQQQMQLLSTFSPIAYEEANKPSAFAKFAGGALNIAGKFGIPALGGGDVLQQQLMAMFSGSGQKGQGFASPQNMNLGYNPYGR